MGAGEGGRRISRDHLAFLRGAVQGVELRTLWERYLPLEGPCDLRVAKRTVAWLKDSLIVAGRRAALPRVAAVLKRDASKLPDIDAPLLEEFAQRYPEGFYTEAELQALWSKEYGGAGQGARRRARLIARQLEAIGQIELLVAADPHADDRVDAWLPEALARRLEAAGISKLRELVAFIDRHGYRWWGRVPRVGEEGARRITDWLARNEASLGLAPRRTALVPRRALELETLQRERPRETGVVPLEFLYVPAELDGARGTNRGTRNKLAAGNDYDAIQTWLAAVAGNPHTFRAYRREAERLLLWAILQRGKALSSLGIEDCVAYAAFLANPQPSACWCGPRTVERWSPAWRPFEGPLAARSRQMAVTILKSLFEWLTRQRYLDSNPWDGVRLKPQSGAGEGGEAFEAPPAEMAERWLTVPQLRFVLEHLERFPDTEATRRKRFAIVFAYGTGLRLSELVAARTVHLSRMPKQHELGEFWVLKVKGKGGRWRRVPVANPVLACLEAYLEARGLPEDPLACPEGTPLIGKLVTASTPTTEPPTLTANMLYRVLKETFVGAAQALEGQGRGADAQRLASASTHWLRHSFGSHGAQQGTPLHHIQAAMGHASLTTTTIYTHSDLELAYAEVERLLQQSLVR